MNRHSKRINPTFRPDIERVKGYIRDSKRGFDGDGYVSKTAIAELRKEGMTIKYDRTKYLYFVVRDESKTD